jgi:hypothetical protein
MVPASPTQDITVQPTQNFLTVPVDLGNTLSDTLDVEVRAGEVSIAQAEVGVRASYIDRLATVLMVIVVLGGLLVFIRRRVMSPDAGTIVGGAPRHDRATGSE